MAQEPTIRVMRKADLDAIAAIDQTAAGSNRRDYFERKLAVLLDPEHTINSSLVAELDGKVVGFMTCTSASSVFPTRARRSRRSVSTELCSTAESRAT